MLRGSAETATEVETTVADRGRVFFNSAAVAVSRGLGGLLRAAALVVAARHLDVEHFGILALCLAFVEMARLLADVGLDVASTNLFAEGTIVAGQVLGSSLTLKLAFAIVAYAGMILTILALYGAHLMPVAVLVGTMIVTWGVSTAIGAYFHGRLRVAEFGWTAVLGAVVTLATVVAVTRAAPVTVVVIAAAFVVGELSAALLSAAVLWRRSGLRLAVRRPALAALLRAAWPVALTQVFVVVYFRLDVAMLGWLKDTAAVGLYGVVFKITEPFLVVPAAIAASVYGGMAPLWARGHDGAAVRLYRSLLVLTLAYAVVVAALLTVFGESILALLLPAYVTGAPALRVLAWSLVFMTVNMLTTATLNSLHQARVTSLIGALTLGVCVIANLALIPPLGIVGASIATVITEAANCVAQVTALSIILRRRRGAAML